MESERIESERGAAASRVGGYSRERLPGGAVRLRGVLRSRPGRASAVVIGVGAALVLGAYALADPVEMGLVMLGGGALVVAGLRRRLLGSLEHETVFEPGRVVRAEHGTQARRVERELLAAELRCLGLERFSAGPLGGESRLYLVQKDRGLLPLGRQAGSGTELRELAEELAGLAGLPLEEREGWPRHEWSEGGGEGF
jgi:hypothetical protein